MKDCKAMYLKQNEMPKKKFGAGVKQKPLEHTTEHQTVRSRTTGKDHEIKFGPVGGGLVPANPFASLAQARFAHAHPEKFGGQKGLKEWDTETKWSGIPKKK